MQVLIHVEAYYILDINLRSNTYDFFNILWFYHVREKKTGIAYQYKCWSSCLIIVQQGLYDIQLTGYKALTSFTDHGIFYITQCGICLLTTFHIPCTCIHFQRKLGKVRPPQVYLSSPLSSSSPCFANYIWYFTCTLKLYGWPNTDFFSTFSCFRTSSFEHLSVHPFISYLIFTLYRLPSYGIYISQFVRFARCCTSGLDFHSKNLQITQGYRYHKLRKTFWKFFRSYSELLSKFCDISFQEYLSKGISHPIFYGDLVYKLRKVKDLPNFISSGSKIVKRLRRRQYDPVIIERTIGLVLGPSTALYEPFLKHCTLTN